jgi:sortase A
MAKGGLIAAMLATVVVLGACAALQQSSSDQGDQGGQAQQKQETPEKQVAPQQGEQKESDEQVAAVEPPSNDMMKLTVPAMDRIENDEIPTGLGTDETLFHDYAGVHIKYTGFPWEEEANVYIAGHRLGFPGTKSYLVFWDLDKLENGDEVILTDANGTRYTYEVFKKFVVNPGDMHVTQPVAGRNVVTLQTCTLPDYSQRLIVQAELTSVS